MVQRMLKQKGLKSKLRGLLLFTFFIFWSSVFSQGVPPPPPPIEIGAVTTGYYECYVGGKFVDRHSDRAKATTHCASLSAANPDKIVGFTYPKFTQITVKGYKTIEVDSVQLNRVADLKGWIDKTVHPNQIWLPFENEGVLMFEQDTIYNWQSKYNFKRTKTFGKVAYENLDVPFQFAEIWLHGLDVYFMVNKETVRTTSWIDGVKFKEFLPGRWNENGETDGLYEAFFGIPADSSGKEFKLEIESVKGKVITYETTLKL